MDLARAPRRAPLTARKKGSGYENDVPPCQPRSQGLNEVASVHVSIQQFASKHKPQTFSRVCFIVCLRLKRGVYR